MLCRPKMDSVPDVFVLMLVSCLLYAGLTILTDDRGFLKIVHTASPLQDVMVKSFPLLIFALVSHTAGEQMLVMPMFWGQN